MFVKGNKLGKGRPKGTPNQSSVEVKNLFQKFIERNEANLQEDYERMRAKMPDKANDVFMKVAEYVHPKLARTEVVGKDGQELTIGIDLSKIQ